VRSAEGDMLRLRRNQNYFNGQNEEEGTDAPEQT
jgi:hypothetical protein